jgi:hypothetical protein
VAEKDDPTTRPSLPAGVVAIPGAVESVSLKLGRSSQMTSVNLGQLMAAIRSDAERLDRELERLVAPEVSKRRA